MEWTGLPRRRIWAYLYSMRDRGLVEIEESGRANPKRRRMRPIDGQWTDWTARRPLLPIRRTMAPQHASSEMAAVGEGA